MPWKETYAMDEKIAFSAQFNESEDSRSELCRQFGISRKAGYKWLERYETQGAEGLSERTRLAYHSPHATPKELVEVIVELRKQHSSWGPKKLRARLEALGHSSLPAPSTIGDLLPTYG